ncbi:hypothetical protein GALMADRAFT_1116340 [Galerina marginata CBS 339.88]|uniref:Uncharacterized protein n=1 Tax=Galerina marginata (strain CBS 339.88) TaxID=685588 RepID=A0A067TCP4_GALM3|nr:hypothetical protein GALMADRAFT_1116340 [Galerina marginata CBS 339.88]
MRTNALYRSRTLFLVLASLGILSTANMIVCYLISFEHTNFMAGPPGFTSCYSKCPGSVCERVLTIFWVPFFLFESIIFVLTVWKCFRSIIQSIGRTPSVTAGWTRLLLCNHGRQYR